MSLQTTILVLPSTGDAQCWLLSRPIGCLASKTSTEATACYVHECCRHTPGLVKAFVCCMQYTLILCASKKMPKQCLDYLTGQSRARRTVGVRMPGDPICQVVASKPWLLVKLSAVLSVLACPATFQGLIVMDGTMPRSGLPMAALGAGWGETSALRSTLLKPLFRLSHYTTGGLAAPGAATAEH